ncbi:hypothetical protein DFH09DRAFT_1270665 [Mycena vulgaris]|nr:hypothetical protein DFH09DRAFT_1270665 [Mycena vulgaris]
MLEPPAPSWLSFIRANAMNSPLEAQRASVDEICEGAFVWAAGIVSTIRIRSRIAHSPLHTLPVLHLAHRRPQDALVFVVNELLGVMLRYDTECDTDGVAAFFELMLCLQLHPAVPDAADVPSPRETCTMRLAARPRAGDDVALSFCTTRRGGTLPWRTRPSAALCDGTSPTYALQRSRHCERGNARARWTGPLGVEDVLRRVRLHDVPRECRTGARVAGPACLVRGAVGGSYMGPFLDSLMLPPGGCQSRRASGWGAARCARGVDELGGSYCARWRKRRRARHGYTRVWYPATQRLYFDLTRRRTWSSSRRARLRRDQLPQLHAACLRWLAQTPGRGSGSDARPQTAEMSGVHGRPTRSYSAAYSSDDSYPTSCLHMDTSYRLCTIYVCGGCYRVLVELLTPRIRETKEKEMASFPIIPKTDLPYLVSELNCLKRRLDDTPPARWSANDLRLAIVFFLRMSVNAPRASSAGSRRPSSLFLRMYALQIYMFPLAIESSRACRLNPW